MIFDKIVNGTEMGNKRKKVRIRLILVRQKIMPTVKWYDPLLSWQIRSGVND